jgi:hypothetical protein
LRAVAAGFGIGAVFENGGRRRRFRAIVVGDTDLAVAEYAVCPGSGGASLVRAFMDEKAGGGTTNPSKTSLAAGGVEMFKCMA